MKIFILLSAVFAATISVPVACSGQEPMTSGNIVMSHGGIIRMDTTHRIVYLVFTGHEFSDGGEIIHATLKRHRITASFFFTGDFYRNSKNRTLITALKEYGHYLGAHSDKHLLYCAWENRDSLLVDKPTFTRDILDNYTAMRAFGISKEDAKYFMPPYEWYNRTIAVWTDELGLQIVNFSPGTSSNADYTIPRMSNYVSSDSIYTRILRYESTHPLRLNGFLLLSHIGTDPERTDKFYLKLDALIGELKLRGYTFGRL